jgi:AcrR family transcriptional regulator
MNAHDPAGRPPRAARKRRADGEKSRAAILAEAARLATVDGIEGLSIARLADAVGMSKSGLFAHFGSKEELQLAVVDAASATFAEQVVEPAEGAATPRERLERLVDGYLAYIAHDTFPGGCFFASVLAEVDMHPGAVRARLVEFLGDWLGRLAAAVAEAQDAGELDRAEEPAQLAFEIEAALFLANAQWIVVRSDEPIERARTAIRRRLEAARPRRRRRTG